MNKSGTGINNSNAQASIESPADFTKLFVDDKISARIIIHDAVTLARLMYLDYHRHS